MSSAVKTGLKKGRFGGPMPWDWEMSVFGLYPYLAVKKAKKESKFRKKKKRI